jgi:hypothetical protein
MIADNKLSSAKSALVQEGKAHTGLLVEGDKSSISLWADHGDRVFVIIEKEGKKYKGFGKLSLVP